MNARAVVAGTVAALSLLVLAGGPAYAGLDPGVGGWAAGDPPAGARATVDPSASDPAALALLDRAALAARSTAYRGVQFVATWDPEQTTTMVVDVEHLPGQGTAVQVRSTAGQPARSVFTPDRGNPVAGDLAVAGGPTGLLARNYAVRADGTGAVAGRPADVVAVRRPTGSLAARFWLDQESGLLLRRETYDSQGRTLRATAFLQVSLDATPATPLPPTLPAPWRQRVDAAGLAALRAQGWPCPAEIGDLTLWDARTVADGTGPVLHLSYSDGLSLVSVFVQPGSLDSSELSGYRSDRWGGAAVQVSRSVPQQVVWAAGGRVFTVVADAGPETVRAVVAALPHDPAPGGLWPRVRRGLARIVSWLNPFG
ncbi:MAG: sigma-E factor regulatory protein RseB domain-containing protein [Actinomycetota bacterium]